MAIDGLAVLRDALGLPFVLKPFRRHKDAGGRLPKVLVVTGEGDCPAPDATADPI